MWAQELRAIRASAAERRRLDATACGCTPDGFSISELDAAVSSSLSTAGTIAAPVSRATRPAASSAGSVFVLSGGRTDVTCDYA